MDSSDLITILYQNEKDKMLSKDHLDSKIMMLGMSSLVLIICILSIKFFYEHFDPIPWLTLIIGGAFGLSIAIIANTRSQQVLTFISNAESERQITTKRTLTNNTNEIKQLVKFYFETINEKQLRTKEKRKLLNTFLSRLKILLVFSYNSTYALGHLILKEDVKKIEEYLKLLNDLLLILEYGDDIKFKNNIIKLSDYSKKLSKILNKINE